MIIALAGRCTTTSILFLALYLGGSTGVSGVVMLGGGGVSAEDEMEVAARIERDAQKKTQERKDEDERLERSLEDGSFWKNCQWAEEDPIEPIEIQNVAPVEASNYNNYNTNPGKRSSDPEFVAQGKFVVKVLGATYPVDSNLSGTKSGGNGSGGTHDDGVGGNSGNGGGGIVIKASYGDEDDHLIRTQNRGRSLSFGAVRDVFEDLPLHLMEYIIPKELATGVYDRVEQNGYLKLPQGQGDMSTSSHSQGESDTEMSTTGSNSTASTTGMINGTPPRHIKNSEAAKLTSTDHVIRAIVAQYKKDVSGCHQSLSERVRDGDIVRYDKDGQGRGGIENFAQLRMLAALHLHEMLQRPWKMHMVVRLQDALLPYLPAWGDVNLDYVDCFVLLLQNSVRRLAELLTELEKELVAASHRVEKGKNEKPKTEKTQGKKTFKIANRRLRDPKNDRSEPSLVDAPESHPEGKPKTEKTQGKKTFKIANRRLRDPKNDRSEPSLVDAPEGHPIGFPPFGGWSSSSEKEKDSLIQREKTLRRMLVVLLGVMVEWVMFNRLSPEVLEVCIRCHLHGERELSDMVPPSRLLLMAELLLSKGHAWLTWMLNSDPSMMHRNMTQRRGRWLQHVVTITDRLKEMIDKPQAKTTYTPEIIEKVERSLNHIQLWRDFNREEIQDRERKSSWSSKEKKTREEQQADDYLEADFQHQQKTPGPGGESFLHDQRLVFPRRYVQLFWDLDSKQSTAHLLSGDPIELPRYMSQQDVGQTWGAEDLRWTLANELETSVETLGILLF